MNPKRFGHIWLGVVGILFAAVPLRAQDNILTVVAHDSFAYSEAVIEAFEAETGITVEVIRLGDAGSIVNQSVLSRNNPLGDVLYGLDNTFLSRALDADLFIPYESPALENVDQAFILDTEYRVTPIDYGDVCLNYDVAYFETNDLPLPETLEALVNTDYRGLLVVENPSISSPGLAFLLTTIVAFGEDDDYDYLDYWRDLVANDVLIADDWTNAYYGQFSGIAGGEGTRPLVVSYASSPPAEIYFADPQPESAPTGSIVADGMCFRQIEFAGILEGTDNLEAGQQWIDFMLSQPFQEDMPLNMFVFPVSDEAELPEVFADYAQIPENPVIVSIDEIDANRETWIQAWIETVLR